MSKVGEEGEDDGEGGGSCLLWSSIGCVPHVHLVPSNPDGWCYLFCFAERRVRTERLSDEANVTNLRHRAWICSHFWLTWPSPVAQW